MSNETKNEIYFLIIRLRAMASLINCLGLGSKGVLDAMEFDKGIDLIISDAGLSLEKDIEKLLEILQKYEVI